MNNNDFRRQYNARTRYSLSMANFKRTIRSNLRIKFVLFSAFGIFVIGMGVYFLYKEIHDYSKWIETNATVTQLKTYKKRHFGKIEDYYKYNSTYEVNGNRVQSEKEAIGEPPFSVNEVIPITVNPNNYYEHRFNFDPTTNGPLILIIMGVFIFISCGLVALFLR